MQEVDEKHETAKSSAPPGASPVLSSDQLVPFHDSTSALAGPELSYQPTAADWVEERHETP